jgi:hypothetical protein
VSTCVFCAGCEKIHESVRDDVVTHAALAYMYMLGFRQEPLALCPPCTRLLTLAQEVPSVRSKS